MIDWQSYLDGSMSPAEKAALDTRLARDSRLKSELEGFKAFRTALMDAGKAVDVPRAILEARLAQVSSAPLPKAPVRFPWTYAIGVGVLALFTLGWYFVSRDPMTVAQTPRRDALSAISPIDAALWVREKTGMAVPAFAMDMSGSNFEGAEVGDDWGCFEYSVEGSRYRVYISRKDHFDDFVSGRQANGTMEFVGPKGTGWRANGLSFYLTGPSEIVTRMACEVEKQSLKPAAKQKLGVRTK